MKKIYQNITLEKLKEVLASLENHIRRHRLFLFTGEQGSGKTTLIKELIQLYFGNASDFSSPTYSLVNEYNINGKTVYHMDWYRIRHAAELEEAGIPEILDDENAVCFIEWPECGKHLWQAKAHLHFYLDRPEEKLHLTLEAHDAR
ncbi:MAG: tRNA (adenosine(37)-N6)-threonylcarbamoyltransferase complex ATPase subunit type 1 TsaE [Bacteroidia bacterium]|nr:tRNA (adenosine(37)-N6)-threonylcarbamoyltransferase complex ATPase subunit type 1 TsaE [Bacteroidia bacterium]